MERSKWEERVWAAFNSPLAAQGAAAIAKVLTFDEARRIAVNVAKLPDALGAK